jgi:hypothetical protein
MKVSQVGAPSVGRSVAWGQKRTDRPGWQDGIGHAKASGRPAKGSGACSPLNLDAAAVKLPTSRRPCVNPFTDLID